MLTFLYRLYGKADVLLYVGITTNPNARFSAHAVDKPWWSDVTHHRIDEVDTALASDIERAAIEAEHPRHNIRHASTIAASDTVARPPRYPMPLSIEEAPEFLNAVQVACIIGCSRERVSHLEANYRLFPRQKLLSPTMKIRRYSRIELRRWLEARPQAPRDAA